MITERHYGTCLSPYEKARKYSHVARCEYQLPLQNIELFENTKRRLTTNRSISFTMYSKNFIATVAMVASLALSIQHRILDFLP